MTAWERAVEAMRKVWPYPYAFDEVTPPMLLAAAPHLERHYREKLAEELRFEVVPPGPTDFERGWLAAADHLTRKEVMG